MATTSKRQPAGASARGKNKAPQAKKAKKKQAPATKKAAKKTPAKNAQAPRRTKKQHALMREDVFVREYVVDLNGRKAAIRAGFSAQSARQRASELLATERVQEKVLAAMQERSERTDIEADAVLMRLNAIATADPRELVELYRCSCRFCWGNDNKYQRTPNEMAVARAEWADALRERGIDEEHAPPFDEAGGIGYNPFSDPNPDCPECFGHGEERVVAKDTRDLSPQARLLYAGVKTSNNGLEIKMHDQTGMLVNVGKHLGMFARNVKVSGELDHRHRGLEDVLEEIDGAGTGIPDHGRGD